MGLTLAAIVSREGVILNETDAYQKIVLNSWDVIKGMVDDIAGSAVILERSFYDFVSRHESHPFNKILESREIVTFPTLSGVKKIREASYGNSIIHVAGDLIGTPEEETGRQVYAIGNRKFYSYLMDIADNIDLLRIRGYVKGEKIAPRTAGMVAGFRQDDYFPDLKPRHWNSLYPSRPPKSRDKVVAWYQSYSRIYPEKGQ